MSKSDHIRDLATSKPDMSPTQIAKIVGCSVALASSVRKSALCNTKVTPPAFGYLSDENQKFIRDEATVSGVARGEMINAIVTDARLDGQQ